LGLGFLGLSQNVKTRRIQKTRQKGFCFLNAHYIFCFLNLLMYDKPATVYRINNPRGYLLSLSLSLSLHSPSQVNRMMVNTFITAMMVNTFITAVATANQVTAVSCSVSDLPGSTHCGQLDSFSPEEKHARIELAACYRLVNLFGCITLSLPPLSSNVLDVLLLIGPHMLYVYAFPMCSV
jgi:hypothetical protein